MISIRPEGIADAAGVHRVNELAFGRPDEARLVDALRAAANPYLSLVAVNEAGEVIGHVLLTPITVEGESAESPLLGLGPLAVLPDLQRQGIGSELMRAALEAARALGSGGVVLLGHPEYYPRFGFQPASRWGLRCEYPVPDEVFMALELRPGGFPAGLVRYHPAFAEV